METQENLIDFYLKQRESKNIDAYPFYQHQYRELFVTLSNKYKLFDWEGKYIIENWMELLRQKAKKRYINWIEEAFNLPLTDKDFNEFLKSVKETEIDELLSHI